MNDGFKFKIGDEVFDVPSHRTGVVDSIIHKRRVFVRFPNRMGSASAWIPVKQLRLVQHKPGPGIREPGCLVLLMVPAILVLVILASSVAHACTSKVGKVCPDELPAAYALTCADGCYLVTKQRLEQYKADGKAVFKLRQDLTKLELVAGDFKAQRDESDVVAESALDHLGVMTIQLLDVQAELADRPSWSTVIVGGAIGAGVGVVATVVYVILKPEVP